MNKQQHFGDGDNVAGNKILKVILNIKPKYFILLIIGILISVISYFHYKPYSISGVVVFKNKKPVSGAEIVLVQPNNQSQVTYTDDFGKFEFPSVSRFSDIKTINVKHQQTSHFFNKDSINASLSSIVLPIDTVMSPFKVTYYNLEGKAIDFLIDGELKNRNGKSILENISIIKNIPLIELMNLKRKFRFRYEPYEAYFTNSEESDESKLFKNRTPYKDDKNFDYEFQDYEFLIGTGNSEYFLIREPQIIKLLSLKSAFQSIRSSKYNWFLTFNANLLNQENRQIIDHFKSNAYYWMGWRFGDRDDINTIRNKSEYLKFIKFVTKNNLPNGFIKVILKFPGLDSDCGLDYSKAEFEILPPLLKFHIAVIENISGENLNINNIYFKENRQNTLRKTTDDEEYFNNISNIISTTFPQGILKPNEKIVLPLYTYFEHLPFDYFIDEINEYTRPDIDSLKEIMFKEIGSKNDLVFTFGPSVQIQRVEVNGYQYAFRKYDPRFITISDGIEAGSCPFAYTYSEILDKWIVEDHILYRLNSKLKENFDTILLSRFNGYIVIKENDPETSYIDFIQVIEEDNLKNTIVHNCNTYLLRDVDNKYHVMNQRDSIHLSFSNNSKLKKNSKFFLVSKGYYIPYKGKKLSYQPSMKRTFRTPPPKNE
jgi:hypothetical protein